MADNVAFTGSVATYTAASDEVTYSGDTSKVQLTRLVHVSGSEGAKTLTEIVTAPGSPSSSFALTTHRPAVSTSHLVTAATTNATSIKASAGLLKSVHVLSVRATPLYVKFHNTAGTPTAGSGVVLTVGVQAGMQRDFVLPDGGRSFATGIGMTVVSDIADAGTTAVAASDAVIEVVYA